MSNKFGRFIVDSMMLALFLSLLALPITSIGLSSSKNLSNEVLGTSSVQEFSPEDLRLQQYRSRIRAEEAAAKESSASNTSPNTEPDF